MTGSQKADRVVAETVARLRARLARALLGGDDPSTDPNAQKDLETLEGGYAGSAKDKVKAFVEAARDPRTTPGVSRRVVLARGQRFLLKLAMEIEDASDEREIKGKTRPTRPRSAEPRTPFDPALLDLAGVGPKTAARLASRGLTSPTEMLYCLPRRYEDRRHVTPIAALRVGERQVTSGTVVGARVFGRPWRRIMELELEDSGAKVFGVWFSNRRPKRDRFSKGDKVTMAGLVGSYKKRLQMAHPVVVGENDSTDRLGKVVPVYPVVSGVPGRTVEKAVRSAVLNADQYLSDPLPPDLLERRDLLALSSAIALVHIPPDDIPARDLDAWVEGRSPAHRRLAYDEFFFIQLALASRRQQMTRGAGPSIRSEKDLASEAGALFGFAPTAAQSRVISEIAADMTGTSPMRRLLQGDVGSGKTLVALAAITAVVRSGFQAALMAPTEILAEQHMRTLYPVLERLKIRTVLHIGSARASTRRKSLTGIESGVVDVAIGTHALVQEAVRFRRLGLAVVDEQHRFGVSQRLSLVDKGPGGASPHLLVMTATPIPRTLALTVHGDLDVSVLDELPPGRASVTTKVWPRENRDKVLDLVSDALDRGEQAYVICPVIEESESIDVTAAVVAFDELVVRFGAERTGLLHGRLSSDAKESAMADFVSGRTRLLVATTVVEVGVDVPGATFMVVEGAERFGLAQLHQLRGRVRRSARPASCHLIADASNRDAVARLEVLAGTDDGFAIAEADLAIRGPGELYGRTQAGLPGFRYGNLARDLDLLVAARKDVAELTRDDPDLHRLASQRLCRELERRLLSGDGPVGEESG